MMHTGTPRRMRTTRWQILLWSSGLLLVGAPLLQPRQAGRRTAPAVPSARPVQPSAQLQARYARLPLSFEANQGQFAHPVRFLARGRGYSLALTAREAVLSLQPHTPVQLPEAHGSRVVSPPHGRSRHTVPSSARPVSVRLRLLNANPEPVARPEKPLPGKVNYLIGNDPKRWRTDVATYGRIRYRQVYPGIDVTYYGNQRQLEYDFEVAPGADPACIRFGVEGARKMELTPGGELVLHTVGGDVVQHAPVTYQVVDGKRKPVTSRYVLQASARQAGFHVGAYDTRRPLVIDPVLSYSTYLGGGDFEYASGIAVDADGSAYVAGVTSSGNFPTHSPIQGSLTGAQSAFVTKLDPTGTALVYSTYLGGSSSATAVGVAVDSARSAYVFGITDAPDFPTRNAIQPVKAGGSDAWVTKLNAAGNGLVYSTYVGGGGNDDHPGGITVSPAGEACLAGWTDSRDFPTRNPLQANHGGGSYDAFAAKINAAGTGFVFSTYLGGSANDLGRAVAVDTAGNVYLTGRTQSANFPTANAFQPQTSNSDEAFVTKILANGGALAYSTYLGGSQLEDGTGVAVDASGAATVVGFTFSTNFPTLNPLQPANAGGGDLFVTRLSPGGSALLWSTYLGGSEEDDVYAVAVDAAGDAFVAGDTFSADFPLADSLHPFRGVADAFVAAYNPSGSAFLYSTLLGGSDFDEALGVAVDPAGNAYVTGGTKSNNFATQNAFQGTYGGGNFDVFVARIGAPGGGGGPVATHFSLTAPATTNAGDPFSVTLTALDAANNPVAGYTGTVHWTSSDPQAALPADYTFTAADNGAHTFTVTLKTAGAQTLTAADTAKPALKGTAPVTVNAGAAVGLRFGQQPTNTTPGATIAPPVTVRVVDAFGNTVASANNTVSLALGVNPSGGTLNGTVSVAAVNGIATFNNLSVDKVGNGYTLAPSAAGLPGPFTDSAPFNVTAKPATHFSVTAPASASSGSAFDVTVTALDADNKTATGYTGAVHWTSSDPQAVLPPDYTFTAADAGVHPFSVTLKTVGSKTITVTDKTTASINGTATVNVTEGVSFVVTTALDTIASDGVTSLREAINAANAHPGPDTVTFKIPGSGLKSITPASALPTITDPVVIDGYTQPGAKVNTAASFATNALPLIEISGSKAGKGANGLTITAGGTTVKGLAINRFQAAADRTGGVGIVLKSAGGSTVAGCFLGTRNTGTAVAANATGVLLDDSPNNTIGGTAPAGANLISANGTGVKVNGDGSARNTILGNVIGTNAAGTATLRGATGVDLGGLDNQIGPGNLISGHMLAGISVATSVSGRVVTGNVIIGNRIGTDATGTKPVANSSGVNLSTGAVRTQVGGVATTARNVISGNKNQGVLINGATGTSVLGNYIGTNAAATAALPNLHGIMVVGSSNNMVGGAAAGARNLISGNKQYGIILTGAGAAGNQVQGSYIGTNAAGTGALPNGTGGVRLDSGASRNQVGGSEPGAGNVISGNRGNGVTITGAGTTGNQLQGNVIGLNAGGNRALSNGDPKALGGGVVIESAGNTVGGRTAGSRNVISGNLLQGVRLNGAGATANTVQGNYLGTDVTGAVAFGNSEGVTLGGGAANNVIGGAEAGSRNLISGNGNGVVLFTASSNQVLGNLIGTDASGMSALPNSTGVLLADASNNLIGGTLPGAGNVISGNRLHGMSLTFNVTENRIQGNYIGTNALGTAAIPNRGNGLDLGNGATKNLIGGDGAGARNVISGNQVYAILMSDFSGGNTVQGNYIGVDVTGTVRIANFEGLHIFSSNNLIGGATPGAGNVISGSDATGVLLTGKAANNVVQGNRIGTNSAGTAAIPNSNGIYHQTSSVNTIGGTSPLAGNLISGNELGLKIEGLNCVVQGNRIGTDRDGAAAVPNTDTGCYIVGDNNTVGGTEPGAGNLLSGNGKYGVSIVQGGGNKVQGNFAGTNAAGTAALPNGIDGVNVSGQGNLIGGATPATRNLLSGNNSNGVALVKVAGPDASGNIVQGNYIGTDVTGTRPVPNQDGVFVLAGGTTVGGTTAGAGNLISGNRSSGVVLRGTYAVVQGNFIGTDAGCTASLPNRIGISVFTSGITVFNTGNTIGGVTAGAGNRIAMNTSTGVAVIQPASANVIRGNAIYDNGGLGIDLQAVDTGGVTPNDPLDKDTGANLQQNYPVLTQATVSGGTVTITGTLNSSPKTKFALDFYRSAAPDPAGFGEGQVYLGSVTVTTDSAGNASFSAPFAVGVAGAGQFFTATASRGEGGVFVETSEFSQAVQALGP